MFLKLEWKFYRYFPASAVAPSSSRLRRFDVQSTNFGFPCDCQTLEKSKKIQPILHLPLVSKSDLPVSVIEEPLQLWTLVEQRHDISLCMQAISDGKQAGAGVSDADTRIAVIIVWRNSWVKKMERDERYIIRTCIWQRCRYAPPQCSGRPRKS